jgi:hypothetical protein
VQEVANEAGISKMCHTILTENLGMHLVAAKSAPHLMTDKRTHRGVSKSVKAFLTMKTMMKTF